MKFHIAVLIKKTVLDKTQLRISTKNVFVVILMLDKNNKNMLFFYVRCCRPVFFDNQFEKNCPPREKAKNFKRPIRVDEFIWLKK